MRPIVVLFVVCVMAAHACCAAEKPNVAPADTHNAPCGACVQPASAKGALLVDQKAGLSFHVIYCGYSMDRR